jgi:uncharacterized repeat protein (TIGR03806 family)
VEKQGVVHCRVQPGAEPRLKLLRHSWRLQAAAGALLAVAIAAVPAAWAGERAGAFRAVDTSALLGGPDPPFPFGAEVAFPHLRFAFPVDITHAGDGSDRLFAVSQDGVIFVFPNRPGVTEAKVFIDLRGRVARRFFEQGLLALAFHPRHRENGEFFVYYSVESLATRVSRFRLREGDRDSAEPGSEELLLEIPQPFWNHNSGSLEFGPDGCLYIGIGDGGAADDPHQNAQDPATLLGSILRIDVDRRDPGKAYAIPSDNPFVGLGERARPEIWALGLRNPWKLCFDRENGTLWAADVGQDLWEEVNVIVRGGNYGWRVREGKHPFDPQARRFSEPLIDPVWEYHHSEGRSITGGAVYRGRELEEIRGWYLCADWLSGNIWGLRWDGERVVESRRLAPPLPGISAFGEDEAGEVYFTAFDAIAPIRREGAVEGRVYRFRRSPRRDAAAPEFPRLLSKTGLFASMKEHTPAAGLIPYDVNVPLWSDGAEKERYIALPEPGRVRFSESGSWQFPLGTVLVKTFSLEMRRGDAASRRRLETRLMVHGAAGWFGTTYVWNDDETEAALLDGYLERSFRIETLEGEVEQTWYFPSRTDCMTCHSRVKGHVLGLDTRQLNRRFAGRGENQLLRFERLGVFDAPLPRDPFALEAYPDWQDESAPAEALARAYLDTNCSFCHAPGGAGLTPLDLRFHSRLASTALLAAARPAATAEGEPAPLLPGDPDGSPLVLRLLARRSQHRPGVSRPPGPMPPLATELVDERAVGVLRRWIAGMAAE